MEEINNKIYAIRNIDVEPKHIVYVGKTKRELWLRLQEHEKDYKNIAKVNWFKSNNYDIFLLEENIIDWQLPNREQYWIDFYGTYNLLNKNRAEQKSYGDALKDAKERVKQMKKRGF